MHSAEVEYVLGTEPEHSSLKATTLDNLPPRTDIAIILLNFKKRAVHLWLMDFNQCKSISMDDAGINQAVVAF